MELEKTYFIRKDYKTNTVKTFSSNPEEYWNEKRIETSFLFQYSIYHYAFEIFKRNNFKSILDIGCGPGTKINIFFKDIAEQITVIDQPNMDKIIKKHCPLANYIGWNLEKPLQVDDKFDLITCFDVIEHLENPNSILQTIKNNLKDNGFAIISTPDRDIRRVKTCMHSPNLEHVREWNKKEFKNYLESQNFKIIEHFNYPNKKLTPILLKLGKMFSKVFIPKKWYAQVVVVKYEK